MSRARTLSAADSGSAETRSGPFETQPHDLDDRATIELPAHPGGRRPTGEAEGGTRPPASIPPGGRHMPFGRRWPPEPPELRADEVEPGPIPDRYEIRTLDEGRFLRCREAPGVEVSIEHHYAFTEVEARKLGEHVVLLDGVGTFGPLIDDAKNLYNLDHHQDCLRAFTLATCEQALILVLKGVELDQGDWTIYANDPDLDTIFAVWVLLNHRRVRQLGPRARDAILPLLRLEGAIDANGFEIAEHCGLPQERLRSERARLDQLFEKERRIKADGDWGTIDFAEYTREMLLEIDRMVYSPSDFADYASVELEYSHVSIGDNKVAVVCRDAGGIYEVEKRLKKNWGDRLGIIALEVAPGQFTLRRAAALSGIVLEDAYETLNLLDPSVDGRPTEKRWGGSDDIGGSPRPDGTGLTPREIGKILKLTYQPLGFWHRLQRYATAIVWTLILALVAGAGVVARQRWTSAGTEAFDAALDLAVAGGLAALGAWLLTLRFSRGWTWLFGWRWPAGEDYLALAPVVLLGAAFGGVWVPVEVSNEAEPLLAAAGAMALTALALALWFPGLIHGLLVLEAGVQSVSGRWFVSRPALVAAALYAAVTTAAAHFLTAHSPLALESPWRLASLAGGAFLCGLAAAMMRERSLSIWPAAALLAAGCVVRLVVGVWYGG